MLAGFTVYAKPFHAGSWETGVLVLEAESGSLYKTIVRRASISDKGSPILTLSLRNQTEHFLSQFDYLLVTGASCCWLIPSEIIPNHTKSIRLGEKYDDYKVEPKEEVTAFSNKSLKEVMLQKLSSKKEGETIEDITALLQLD